MATDPLLRQGPDSTDLVLSAGPAGPAWNALTSAGSALFIPLVLGVPTLLVAFWMALAGARASTVFVVVGVIAGLEYLLGWLALAFSQARDILRVEFAPTGVPASLRLVRAAGPDDWLPVDTLREVRLTHEVVEPYQGDRKPAVSTLALELVLRGGGSGSPRSRSAATRNGSPTHWRPYSARLRSWCSCAPSAARAIGRSPTPAGPAAVRPRLTRVAADPGAARGAPRPGSARRCSRPQAVRGSLPPLGHVEPPGRLGRNRVLRPRVAE
ncbi:hypothetical protein ACFWCB_05855 [Streptomyces sp. NPDC060048]|uniref:hypothetical protein n=1 Tax=unclassified Streptomyces TaxID=2593676 RepID=UPI0036B606FA